MTEGVSYEGIILENQNIGNHWRNGMPIDERKIKSIPDGIITWVTPEAYDGYRKGRDSACVDIAVVTEKEDGTPAILLSKRVKNVCYGGKWWIYGGALQAYRSVISFISERAERECGVAVHPEVLVGVYRTMSDDFVGSTLQLCYATRVDIHDIRARKSVDDAHSDVRLFSLSELNSIPADEQHWYVLRVAEIALRCMPTKNEMQK